MPTEERYTISQAAGLVGVTPKTLRAWESRKKIQKPPRDRNGSRFYRQADVERARSFKEWVVEPEGKRKRT